MGQQRGFSTAFIDIAVAVSAYVGLGGRLTIRPRSSDQCDLAGTTRENVLLKDETYALRLEAGSADRRRELRRGSKPKHILIDVPQLVRYRRQLLFGITEQLSAAL